MASSFITLPPSLGNIPLNAPKGTETFTPSSGYTNQPSNPNTLQSPAQQAAPYQQVSQNLSNAFGGKQITIPGPTGAAGYHGDPLPGGQPEVNVNGVSAPRGVYVDPTPGGFGRSDRPDLSNGFKQDLYNKYLASIAPPSVAQQGLPPSAPPASVQKPAPPSPTGATSPLSSITSASLGGAQNQAFPASAQLAPGGKDPNLVGRFLEDQKNRTLTPQSLTAMGFPAAALGAAGVGAIGAGLSSAELAGALLGGGGVAEGQNVENQVQPWLQRASQGIGNFGQQAENLLKGPVGKSVAGATAGGVGAGVAGGGFAASAPTNQAQGAFVPGMGTPPSQQGGQFIGPTGQGISKGADQTGKSLAPTSTTAQQTQQLQGFLTDPTNNPAQTVSANLANPNGIKMINKQIDVAQKSGDFQTVSKLVDLAQSAQQNMVFQQQIQAIINAISQGFGSAPSPDITAARQPMVQQGIFGGLESPQMPQQTFVGGSDTNQGPTTYLRPQIPQVIPGMPTPTFPMPQNQSNNAFAPGGGRVPNQFPYSQ